MSWVGVPWFIGHTGAIHPPEVLRLFAYAATGGGEGPVTLSDLKVRARDVAAGSVIVGSGGAIILNRNTGGQSQSYIALNPSDDILTVPGTSGIARYDLVVARIKDDQYPGFSAPADPTIGPYVESFLVQGVGSAVKTAEELNLGYPAIALARIAQPIGNAAVTNGMITDLRRIPSPRMFPKRFITNPTVAETLTSTVSDGVAFPAASAAWTVDIPKWAAYCQVRADWALAAPPGNATGSLWVRIGAAGGDYVDIQHVGYNTPGSTNKQRYPQFAADTVVVPTSLRGTTAALSLRGHQSTADAGASIQLDAGGPVILDLQFFEQV